MREDPSLSVIIPVYNEERTISSILEVVRTWGKANEIIVVDDGSADKTTRAVKKFGSDVRLLVSRKNRGKGFALSWGIRKSQGDCLLFLDGDIVGLSHKDLDAMVRPILRNKADMVLGVARFWSATIGNASIKPFSEITGERVLLRRNIQEHIGRLERLGYGVELFLNELHKKKRIVRVTLPHVFILGKFDKHTIPDAMISYIKEATELIAQAVRQGAGELPPQARKVFRGVQAYLKSVLDYFQ